MPKWDDENLWAKSAKRGRGETHARKQKPEEFRKAMVTRETVWDKIKKGKGEK
jgi:hypothetical protein